VSTLSICFLCALTEGTIYREEKERKEREKRERRESIHLLEHHSGICGREGNNIICFIMACFCVCIKLLHFTP
jgi:hypothetical protein